MVQSITETMAYFSNITFYF